MINLESLLSPSSGNFLGYLHGRGCYLEVYVEGSELSPSSSTSFPINPLEFYKNNYINSIYSSSYCSSVLLFTVKFILFLNCLDKDLLCHLFFPLQVCPTYRKVAMIFTPWALFCHITARILWYLAKYPCLDLLEPLFDSSFHVGITILVSETLALIICEMMAWEEIRSQTRNRLNHPGAPLFAIVSTYSEIPVCVPTICFLDYLLYNFAFFW